MLHWFTPSHSSSHPKSRALYAKTLVLEATAPMDRSASLPMAHNSSDAMKLLTLATKLSLALVS